MINEVKYQFSSSSVANRFLNELKHWPKADVKARLFKASNSVAVCYEYEAGNFDYTCSDLDELASLHDGVEI